MSEQMRILNLRRMSPPTGVPQLKKRKQGTDRTFARRIVAEFSELVAAGKRVPQELLDYLAQAFDAYLVKHVPLDKALHLRRGRGKPEGGTSRDTIQIALCVALLKAKGYCPTKVKGIMSLAFPAVARTFQRAVKKNAWIKDWQPRHLAAALNEGSASKLKGAIDKYEATRQ